MYDKILVPLDGSALAERAVRHAGEISRGTDAVILLLQAIHIPVPVVPEAVLFAEGKVLEEASRAAAEYLERVAMELRSEGRKVRTLVEQRPPEEAILRVAEREDADLIVMSTHGRSGWSRLVMGSVAEGVLHGTHRTVMLVKPEIPAVATLADDDWFLHVP